MHLKGRVLSIAGSDCGGGAGIQADIKTITALGAYAATAITAITVQDTVKVDQVYPLPPSLVADQIAAVLADPGVDAIKVGMLVNAETIAAVGQVLRGRATAVPLVLDPVMIATSGDSLLEDDAVEALRGLFGLARLITPNIPEASRLCGRPITTLYDMRYAALALLHDGAEAVLIKGGHLASPLVTDLLVTRDAERRFEHPRLSGRNTHGTGCTLASAIATGLAQNMALADAVARAISYVERAIQTAPGLGAGHGPLNHAVTVQAFAPDEQARVALSARA